MSGHVGHGAEGGLHDQAQRLLVHGQPAGDGGAQGAAEEDDLAGWYLPLPGQVVPGGLRIQVGALFRRTPFALSIPAVVEDQNVQAQLMEEDDGLHAVGDVARVAVAEQQGGPWIFRRDKPAVQGEAVAGLELKLFIFQAVAAGGEHKLPRGEVGVVEHARLGEIEEQRQCGVEDASGDHYGYEGSEHDRMDVVFEVLSIESNRITGDP